MADERIEKQFNKEISDRLSSENWSRGIAQKVVKSCHSQRRNRILLKSLPLTLAALFVFAINVSFHHQHEEKPSQHAKNMKENRPGLQNIKPVSFKKN